MKNKIRFARLRWWEDDDKVGQVATIFCLTIACLACVAIILIQNNVF